MFFDSCRQSKGGLVIMLRVGTTAVCCVSSTSTLLSSSQPMVSLSSSLLSRGRCETTGEHHSYKPGKVTLAIRAVFQALTPANFRKKLALRMQAGMEKVEELEKEQMWLRRHGSPLTVMGLPDHAELPEVKARYRDLVLETHPDSSSALVDRDEYLILQTAYKMATNPNSLFHQNHSAPQIYEELMANRPLLQRVNKVSLFALFSYAIMIFIGTVVAHAVFKEICIRSLQWADPEFYDFMVAQEKEEERKREAGEFVDTDPKRYAPTVIRKLVYPGRFVHGYEETPELLYNETKKETEKSTR